MLYESGNFIGAITYLDEGLKRNPGFTELHYQSAAYCFEAGKKNKARLHLKTALSTDFEGHYLLFHIDPSLKFEPEVWDLINFFK